jgi:hypothetical protein
VKSSDPRPESYKIDVDTLEIVGAPASTRRAWAARKAVLLPHRSHCMCCLKRQLEEDGRPTLGFFKPQTIERLIITSDASEWTEKELAKLRQSTFFENAPKSELQKIPFRFSYVYRCDHVECQGHTMTCTDWEVLEAYRSWRRRYPLDWESRFRAKFELWLREQDAHFFVGTVHNHPREWIIVGIWYAPFSDAEQMSLI